MTSTYNHSITVVICTRDRPEDLDSCLRSIESQTVLPSLVIIVSGSKDSCSESVHQAFDKLQIQVVDCYEHNISISRNVGLEHSSSEFVLFIDDDAEARPDWIQSYLHAIKRFPQASALGGDVFDSRLDPTELEFSHGMIRSTGKQKPVCVKSDSPRSGRWKKNVKGCNFVVRKSDVLALGGFDPFFAFAFDEADIVMTMHSSGKDVVHIPEAVVDHAHTPGHYRQLNHLDRDWGVEFASHMMFVLKHTQGGERLIGRAVVSLRFCKLILRCTIGKLLGSITLSQAYKNIAQASQGIRETKRVYQQRSM